MYCEYCKAHYKSKKKHKENCKRTKLLEDILEENRRPQKRQRGGGDKQNLPALDEGLVGQAQRLAETLQRENPAVAAIARDEW